MASNNDAELTLGLNAGQFTVGLERSTAALQTMAAAAEAQSAAIARSLEGVKTAMKGVQSSFEGATSSIQGALSKMQSGFAALTAVVAGGAMFKNFISGFSDTVGEATKLSKVFGMSVESASELNVALKLTGQTAEGFSDSAFKLLRQVNSNEKGLNAMGLATKDAHGDMLPLMDMMKGGTQLLLDYKEGADRDAAAMFMFGRSAQDAMSIMKLNETVMARAKVLAAEYGLQVGPEAQGNLKKYKMAQAELGLVWEAVQHKVGEALMPVLTQLAGWFSSIGPTAIAVFSVALKGVITAAELVIGSFRLLWSVVEEWGRKVMSAFSTLGDAAAKAIKWDFSGAKKSLDAGYAEQNAIAEKAMKDRQAISQGVHDRLEKLWSKAPEGGGETGDPKSSGKNLRWHKPEDDKGGADKSRMSAWEAELAQDQLAYELKKKEQGDYQQWSLAQTAQFWKEKAAQKNLTEAEQIAVTRKYAESERALLKEAFDQRIAAMREEAAEAKKSFDERIRIANVIKQKMADTYGSDSVQAKEAARAVIALEQQKAAMILKTELEINAGRARLATQQLAIEEEAVNAAYSLGQISSQQKIAAQMQFADRAYEIALQAALRELELYTVGTTEYQRALDKRAELDAAYDLKKRQLADAAAIEANKPKAGFESAASGTLQNAMDGLLNGQMTAAAALRSLWTGLYKDFVTNMITKPLADLAMRAIRESGIYQQITGALLTQLGISKTAEVVDSKSTAASVIPAKAATAAAGAAESVASIPYVGPALAAAAYAETMAMVMGGLAIASASGGFDIPAGANPLTQLHEREMVLPAKYADPMRDMLSGGGGGGGVTINIQAHDATGFDRLLSNRADHLINVVKQAIRDGKR